MWKKSLQTKALFVEEGNNQSSDGGLAMIQMEKLTETLRRCVFLSGATYPITTEQELRHISHQAKQITTDTS